MVDFIILTMSFISAWLLTAQIFKMHLDNNFDIKTSNSFKFNVMVYEYTKYKSFGKLTAFADNVKYEFIDDDFYFSSILNSNIGNYVTVSCLNKVEGIVIFSSVLYLYDVNVKSYKHFDKFN